MSFSRYAIYYAPPPGPLADMGARWLGWDIATAAPREHPGVPGLPRPVEEITRTPRRYGFHGTMKPPFRLAAGQDAATLTRAATTLCADQPRFDLPALALKRIGRFLALVPSAPSPELEALAAQVVRHLDPFRAPATEAELARRKAKGLSPRQEALLADWGYPYVMEEFRFHLTLTGPLAEEEAAPVEAALRDLLAPWIGQPLPVTDLCLTGEDSEGRHRILQRLPLR